MTKAVEFYRVDEMPEIAPKLGFYFKQVAARQGVQFAAEVMKHSGFPIQAALGLLVYGSYSLQRGA